MSRIAFNEITFLTETIERVNGDIEELKNTFGLQTCNLINVEVDNRPLSKLKIILIDSR